VEGRRGRTGWHIDVSGERSLFPEYENGFAATSACSDGSMSEANQQLARCVSSQGNRVVLSGIGGDEIMGGVPTPIPELMDLLARAQWGLLARQLKLWALDKRKPWFHLLFEAARGFLPLGIVGVAKHRRPPSWLTPAFIRSQTAALTGYQSRIPLAGPLPSYQENISTLHFCAGKLRTLRCLPIPRARCVIPILIATCLSLCTRFPVNSVSVRGSAVP
jgi:asparagine synthase (glutamine-hydrolysing)